MVASVRVAADDEALAPKRAKLSPAATAEFEAIKAELRDAIARAAGASAYKRLRDELLSIDSYWKRRARFHSIEADGMFSPKQQKLLELEIALHFQQAEDVITVLKFLQENHADDADFSEQVARINRALDENKETPFGGRLKAALNATIALQPAATLVRGGSGPPNSALATLVRLVDSNPIAGLQSAAQQIFAEYTRLRVEQSLSNSEPCYLDLIWFRLSKPLVDANLGNLDVDSVLSIFYLLLKCCVLEAAGALPSSFFEAADTLGIARERRPCESWRACLRLLMAIAVRRQGERASSLTAYLRAHVETTTLAQLSARAIDELDVCADEELARFLLSFAIGMRQHYESVSHRLVVLPGNVFRMSSSAIAAYWTQNFAPIENADSELDLTVLGDHAGAYADCLSVARNVFTAYQSRASSDTQIEPRLRALLLKFHVPNAFSTIGQSLLVAGRYAEAAKFVSLAIRTTTDKTEQTELCLQLLQASVVMRRLNAAQKMAVELLGEKHLVSATIDASCGVFPPFASVCDGFIRLPNEMVYQYVAILLLHVAFIAYVRARQDGRREHASAAATIMLLAAQCSWESGCRRLGDSLDVLRDTSICIVNAVGLLSNPQLANALINCRTTLLEGARTIEHPNTRAELSKVGATDVFDRSKPFSDLLLYLFGHSSSSSIINDLFE